MSIITTLSIKAIIISQISVVKFQASCCCETCFLDMHNSENIELTKIRKEIFFKSGDTDI